MLFGSYSLFQYVTEDKDGASMVIEYGVPGVEPEKVKVEYTSNQVLVNGTVLARVSDRFDLNRAKATLKYGLLRISVPENTSGRGVIPVTVT